MVAEIVPQSTRRAQRRQSKNRHLDLQIAWAFRSKSLVDRLIVIELFSCSTLLLEQTKMWRATTSRLEWWKQKMDKLFPSSMNNRPCKKNEALWRLAKRLGLTCIGIEAIKVIRAKYAYRRPNPVWLRTMQVRIVYAICVSIDTHNA